MDADGQYRGVDHMIHQAEGFTNYTVFSLWDTYRALHPLFNVINRERNRDMVMSMLEHYRQSVYGYRPFHAEALRTECTQGFARVVAYG